jgi:hypothetical protein
MLSKKVGPGWSCILALLDSRSVRTPSIDDVPLTHQLMCSIDRGVTQLPPPLKVPVNCRFDIVCDDEQSACTMHGCFSAPKWPEMIYH